ncbi:MAG: Na/Pi cotransporter family protein [Clostridiales bacterium]|nr:Na/Pi cotransporter family protein [Clostridiales bacterium]
MGLNMLIMLAGGIGLFLYGMKMMGDGLEKAAGNRLKRLLEILTANKYMGLLVGTVVTAMIQSSAATIVMVVGFVNAGFMTLNQAIGVIMGANIGTTMTAFLISLNLSDIAPVIVFIGAGFAFFSKNKLMKSIGEVLVGFGILFIGMHTMSEAMIPLRDHEGFQRLLVTMTNPILGVLVGAVMTVLLQSSSASVGILQALAAQGLIGLEGGIYILFGMNIGTTITAMLASIGTNTNAKRAAFLHLIIKGIGTVVFMIAMALGVPFVEFIIKISPSGGLSQVANAHIAFNIINAIILIPFSKSLVKLSQKLVHGKKDEVDEMSLKYLDKRILETPPVVVIQIMKEVGRMADVAVSNVKLALEAFFTKSQKAIDEVYRKEEIINYLNQEITHFLTMCNGLGLPQSDYQLISGLYHVVNDIERIGDHAENLVEYAEYSMGNRLVYSDIAKEELTRMEEKVMKMLNTTVGALKERNRDLAWKVIGLEDEVDNLKDELRASHIDRLNTQRCTAASGVIFLDIVTNLERIADHAYNIAQSVLNGGKHIG